MLSDWILHTFYTVSLWSELLMTVLTLAYSCYATASSPSSREGNFQRGGGVEAAILVIVSFVACPFIIALGQWACPLALSANFYPLLGTHENFGASEVAGVFLSALLAYVTHGTWHHWYSVTPGRQIILLSKACASLLPQPQLCEEW